MNMLTKQFRKLCLVVMGVVILGLMGGLTVKAATLPEVSPEVFVYDGAEKLSQGTKDFVIKLNQAFEQTEDKPQIALAIVSSLEELTVEEYANQLFNHWGVGQADQNNGVLVLIAPEEGKIRIEVGYGLEWTLTDSFTKWVINQYSPLLTEGQFDQASQEMVTALAVNVNEAYDYENQQIFGTEDVSPDDYVQPVTSYQDQTDYAFLGGRLKSYKEPSDPEDVYLIFVIIFAIVSLILGIAKGGDNDDSSGGWGGGSSSSWGSSSSSSSSSRSSGSSFGGGRSGGGGSSGSF